MDFKLSQSKLRDWREMCPIEFKAKHIDKTWQFEPSIEMEWGNYFETQCIGSTIGGAFSFAKSIHGEKMLKSIFKERVDAQVLQYRKFKDIVCEKVLSRQEYISTTVKDSTGQLIPIEGTIDMKWQLKSAKRAVMDLKLTGDTDNDFGKFAWGSPEKMDLSQIVHYGLLDKEYHKVEYPVTKYWVFDKGVDLKKKLIDVKVSENALYHHIENLSEAYNEISLAIAMDDWKPKNTYENCSKCKAPCKFQRIMPEDYIVEL